MWRRKTLSDFMPRNLFFHERPQMDAEAAAGHELDSASEQTFQRDTQVVEVVVGRRLELDQEVDVAASLGLITHVRTEQADALDRVPPEHVLVLVKRPQNAGPGECRGPRHGHQRSRMAGPRGTAQICFGMWGARVPSLVVVEGE